MAQTDSENRMKASLKKLAAGPRLSKNLTEEEAEDALALILDNQVSSIRAGGLSHCSTNETGNRTRKCRLLAGSAKPRCICQD